MVSEISGEWLAPMGQRVTGPEIVSVTESVLAKGLSSLSESVRLLIEQAMILRVEPMAIHPSPLIPS
ncbi:hypothetical protein HZH68_003806 [Vespula germanica]|uniref:Uncharacterized protein n=1 Tax=Vespula germanica TaxID=30212 RepID=A0A834NGM8_VESGE|nr:hypothetical protein HZH68_003806 [Vespula germanica]